MLVLIMNFFGVAVNISQATSLEITRVQKSDESPRDSDRRECKQWPQKRCMSVSNGLEHPYHCEYKGREKIP
jgi:hypothetical protein